MRHRRSVAVATGLAVTATLGLGFQAAMAQPDQPSRWDFDADGNPDLVLQASRAASSGAEKSGALGAVLGKADAPDKDNTQLVAETEFLGDDAEVPGRQRDNDRFGTATDSGDFDGDGYADLAVCTEPETGENAEATGLTLVFGGEQGLQQSVAVELDNPDFDRYEPCQDLEVADINQDGTSDLVISAEDTLSWAPGSSDARQANGWNWQVIDDEIDSGSEGHFDAVGSGDVNGDDLPDLAYAAVSCETCDYAYVSYRVKLGGPEGFSDTTWLTNSADDQTAAVGLPEPQFGDLDGDGYDDIALGQPNVSVEDEMGSGQVDVWYGSDSGPNEEPDDNITQSTSGIPGTSESNDQFGFSVDVGDTDGDGFAELAIGVPYEASGTNDEAGRVVIVPGTSGGLDTEASKGINQDTDGIPGSMEDYDRFGYQVDMRPMPGQDELGLQVGSPGENDREGRVHAIGSNDTWWFQPRDIDITTDGDIWLGS